MDNRPHRILAMGIGRDIVSVLVGIDSDGARGTQELFAESSKNDRISLRLGYFVDKTMPITNPSE